MTYSFDADRFSVCSTFTQARYPLAQLWDWRETERVIIVLPTPGNFYVLPKRGVDMPALERLRGHLAKTRKLALGSGRLMPLDKTNRLEHRVKLLESQVHRLQEELKRIASLVETTSNESCNR